MTENEVKLLTMFAEANPEKFTFSRENGRYILHFHDEETNFFGAIDPLDAIRLLQLK